MREFSVSRGFGIGRQKIGSLPPVPVLGALTLSATSVAEDALAGTVVGAVMGYTLGGTLSLTDDASNRFALSGTTIVTGLTGLGYETAVSHQITIRENFTGSPNSPRDTVLTINVTNAVEPLPSAIFETVDLTGDTLTVETDRDCDVAYMVLPSSDPAPSAATIYSAGSSFSVTSASGEVLDIDDGLDPDDYNIHLVTHDGGTNFGTVNSTATFTVADPSAPVSLLTATPFFVWRTTTPTFNLGTIPAGAYVLGITARQDAAGGAPATIAAEGTTFTLAPGSVSIRGNTYTAFYTGTFGSEFSGDWTTPMVTATLWAFGLFPIGNRTISDIVIANGTTVIDLSVDTLAGDAVVAVAGSKNTNGTFDAPLVAYNGFTASSSLAVSFAHLAIASAGTPTAFTARNAGSANDFCATLLVLREAA